MAGLSLLAVAALALSACAGGEAPEEGSGQTGAGVPSSSFPTTAASPEQVEGASSAASPSTAKGTEPSAADESDDQGWRIGEHRVDGTERPYTPPLIVAAISQVLDADVDSETTDADAGLRQLDRARDHALTVSPSVNAAKGCLGRQHDGYEMFRDNAAGVVTGTAEEDGRTETVTVEVLRSDEALQAQIDHELEQEKACGVAFEVPAEVTTLRNVEIAGADARLWQNSAPERDGEEAMVTRVLTVNAGHLRIVDRSEVPADEAETAEEYLEDRRERMDELLDHLAEGGEPLAPVDAPMPWTAEADEADEAPAAQDAFAADEATVEKVLAARLGDRAEVEVITRQDREAAADEAPVDGMYESPALFTDACRAAEAESTRREAALAEVRYLASVEDDELQRTRRVLVLPLSDAEAFGDHQRASAQVESECGRTAGADSDALATHQSTPGEGGASLWQIEVPASGEWDTVAVRTTSLGLPGVHLGVTDSFSRRGVDQPNDEFQKEARTLMEAIAEDLRKAADD